MQPDKTLVMLVTWINLIEDQNEKVLAAFKQVQEQNKRGQEENTKLKAEIDKLKKKKGKASEED